MAAGYGWEPDVVASMTDAQVDYFYKHLPLVEARKHYPIAQLTADVREFIFPRYTEDDPDEQSAKPPRARKPWSALEVLPWYASFGEAERMTLDEARILLEHLDGLPSWARSVAPVDEAREVVTESLN